MSVNFTILNYEFEAKGVVISSLKEIYLNLKNDSLLNMKHKFNRDAITTLCLP